MRAMSLMAATAAAVLLGAAAPAQADHKGKVPWIDNVEEGMMMAKKTGQPIMLFFSADW